jgi:pyrroline-5-carboxylate reductase
LKKTISFIGCGKMATALISSIYKNNVAKEIYASGKNIDNLENVRQKYEVITSNDNKKVIKNADIVFLCVKPQNMNEVLDEIKDSVKNQLIVSIAAGITLKQIESKLKNARVIRVMPNLNCLVSEMACGFSKGKHANKEDIKNVSKILNNAGTAFEVKEELIDAVSIISGSGPAFYAFFIQSFAEAGIKEGLPREIAYSLAAKTAQGTGKLLLDTDLEAKDLIKMVSSKKGITLEGLKVLKNHKVKDILEKAYNAAYKRSKELGEN